MQSEPANFTIFGILSLIPTEERKYDRHRINETMGENSRPKVPSGEQVS